MKLPVKTVLLAVLMHSLWTLVASQGWRDLETIPMDDDGEDSIPMDDDGEETRPPRLTVAPTPTTTVAPTPTTTMAPTPTTTLAPTPTTTVSPPGGGGCNPPSGSSVTFPTQVDLDRVRRCRNRILFCNSVITKPQYRYWEDAGLDNTKQKRLYLTEVYTPPRSATRNLVMGFAGQQWENGLRSGITGQSGNYRDAFGRKDGTKRVSIDPSLVSEVMREGFFQPANTFVGMVFDARFNFQFSRDENNDAERGYLDYIASKVMAENLETIYLVGHSRGGCLVMRLAPKIASRFPNARLIVHTLDPVCRRENAITGFTRGEFGVSLPSVDNPTTNTDWRTFTTDMTQQFNVSQRRCVAIRNFLSGEKAVSFFDNARGFGHRGFTGVTDSLRHPGNNFAWYTQSFHTQDHDDIMYLHNVDARLHLRAAMTSMPCPCGVPPTRTPSPPTPTPIDCGDWDIYGCNECGVCQ